MLSWTKNKFLTIFITKQCSVLPYCTLHRIGLRSIKNLSNFWNQIDQVMGTPRVLKCLKLISFYPLPIPLKAKLTIPIWAPRVPLLMLANYSYFQSQIIQLSSLATLDSADALANYIFHTMGFPGTSKLILEYVNQHHESILLPQSFS